MSIFARASVFAVLTTLGVLESPSSAQTPAGRVASASTPSMAPWKQFGGPNRNFMVDAAGLA